MNLKFLKKFKKNIILLPLSALGLTPLVWFYGRGDCIINGVDTNFPLNPLIWFLRRFYVWNAISNGGSDFSSSTAGLFFHFIQVVPYTLGLSLGHVQIFSLIFWFMLIVLASFCLARTIFPKHSLVQLLFVALYTFNTYLFNSWENVKVANLSLVSAIPLVITLLILRWENKITLCKTAIYSMFIGIILSGSGINPSYFLAFFLIVLVLTISEILVKFNKNHILEKIRDTFLISFIIILVNLFWILPTLNFIFGKISPAGSIDKIGFVNWIDSLSENTSILNVVRGQGAWDWYAFDSKTGLPLYIPYVLNYFYKFPFLVFSFLIPSLAILSFIFQDKKRNTLYTAFGLMLLLGIFLGVGTHLPTGIILRWFLNHLPFATLFRSPWYIFTPLVILALAGLVSLFFDYLSKKWADKNLAIRATLSGAIILLILTNLIYSYPLVLGKIFRPNQSDSFFVQFPKYIFEAQKWLSGQGQGRIIGYPDDEIERFKWGYRGIESILGLLADNEVISQSLNTPDSPVAVLTKSFYQSLKKGQLDKANNLASGLNVSMIFEKLDQESLSPQLPSSILSQSYQQFGEWKFYNLPPEYVTPKIHIISSLLYGYPIKQGVEMMGMIESNEALINPGDDVIRGLSKVSDAAGLIILAQNSQNSDLQDFFSGPSRLSKRLLWRDLSKVEFTVEIFSDGAYQPTLERYRLEDFGIDLTKGLNLEIDQNKSSWEIDRLSDSYVYFKPLMLTQGVHKILINLTTPNLVKGDLEQKIDFEIEGVGEFAVKEESSTRFLSIFNKSDHDIAANFPISPFDPLSFYMIRVRYKQIYGNHASILMSQRNNTTLVKAYVESMPNYPEWNVFSFYFEPVKTNSTLKLGLLSPFTKDVLGTKVFYNDLAVYKVFSNNLFFIKKDGDSILSSPRINFSQTSPTLYDGRMEDGNRPHIITFSENYSPDWEISLYDNKGSKLPISPKHFSINLYANGWYIENAPGIYKFKIFYQPQKLFWIGLAIASTTIILLTSITIVFIIKKKIILNK